MDRVVVECVVVPDVEVAAVRSDDGLARVDFWTCVCVFSICIPRLFLAFLALPNWGWILNVSRIGIFSCCVCLLLVAFWFRIVASSHGADRSSSCPIRSRLVLACACSAAVCLWLQA